MMPDDTVYLQHILDAIQKIDMYLAGIDEPSFYAHSLIQDGVIPVSYTHLDVYKRQG